MDFQDIIIKKRDKQKLTKEEISSSSGVTDGSLPGLPDFRSAYGHSAQRQDAEETAQMTMEMAHSGAFVLI